jgi:ribosome-binding protein aMBF1 (putative translation factor)
MDTAESETKTRNVEQANKSGGKAESKNFSHEYEKFLLCRLGETIQKKRLESGLSQEQLCVLTEMNRTYLSDIERGVSNASFLVLFKIAKALKLELWQVLKDVDLSEREQPEAKNGSAP